jgi:hypothetical protein
LANGGEFLGGSAVAGVGNFEPVGEYEGYGECASAVLYSAGEKIFEAGGGLQEGSEGA